MLFFKTDMRKKETKAAKKTELKTQIKNEFTLYDTKKNKITTNNYKTSQNNHKYIWKKLIKSQH